MTGTEACNEIINQVNQVVLGKEDVIRKVTAAIIAGGHILIEDIPGVGKTTMAKAFAAAMGLDNKRIQFTTDVMPSDITGFTMFDKAKNEFVYKSGAVMCNLLLADEINRTSSKTQAALLEVMEERKVTVDGKTKKVPSPFFVIATQNPIGSVGTAMLPESQLDRFMFRLYMGYPSPEDEVKLLISKKEEGNLIQKVQAVINREDLAYIQKEVSQVFVHEKIAEYVVKLVNTTRNNSNIELGVSPRGTLAVVKAAQAWAYIEGRNYVVPDDIKKVFYDTANHRIILSGRGKTQGLKIREMIGEAIRQISVEK